VEYDQGTSEETQETYDPKTPTALTQEHSEESSVGDAPAGVPGTASNVPATTAAKPAPGTTPTNPAGATASMPEHSMSKSDSTTFAISKVIHRSVEPAGRVRRIAAAVLVDDAVEWTETAGRRTSTRRKRTAEEMKEIEQLARAAIGVDAQRGDVLAVENLSFQQEPLEALPPPSQVEHWRTRLEPWAWTLRYVGLGALFAVVYWLILRPVKKEALAAFRGLPGRAGKTGGGAGSNALSALGDEPSGGEGGGAGAEGPRTQQLTRMLADKVKAEPANASRLVESWMRSGEEGK
jgi:flagellar M-ring protein FliF